MNICIPGEDDEQFLLSVHITGWLQSEGPCKNFHTSLTTLHTAIQPYLRPHHYTQQSTTETRSCYIPDVAYTLTHDQMMPNINGLYYGLVLSLML